MKKQFTLSVHFLFFFLATCLMQSCGGCEQKESKAPPIETIGARKCSKVAQTSISHSCTGLDSIRTCVSTWTAPSGVNTFLVKMMGLSDGGEPLQPFFEQVVLGNTVTIDSLIQGKRYRFTIESICAGGQKSEIVIDDLVRK